MELKKKERLEQEEKLSKIAPEPFYNGTKPKRG
jgi:hypothetical protein